METPYIDASLLSRFTLLPSPPPFEVQGTVGPSVSRNLSATSSFTSTGSVTDMLSKLDASTDRGGDADAAVAAARGNCSGSTFADARERERVIAALQSDDNVRD